MANALGIVEQVGCTYAHVPSLFSRPLPPTTQRKTWVTHCLCICV